MKSRQSFSLVVTLACLLGESSSDVFADAPVEQTSPKLSASQTWKLIVSARAALDQAMPTDLATLSPESLAAARNRAVDQAGKLEEMTSEFASDFPGDENLLRVVAHGAYAFGIEGALGYPGSLHEAADHISGIEFESELAKDTPALSSHAKVLRDLCESNLIAGSIAALRFRPTNNLVYSTLLDLAQKAKSDAGKSLARELITNSLLPSVWVDSAKNILNRQFSIGQAFDIKIIGIDGKEVDSQKLRGKVLLVNFWATTCPPCIGEIPELKSLCKRYGDRGLEIIGVSLDGETKPILKVLREKEITWPNMVDVGGSMNGFARKCGIFAIPNNWLVDKQGILREIAADRDQLEVKIKVLLAESPVL